MSLFTREAPSMVYHSFGVAEETGPDNLKLDRAETADLIVTLRNAGSSCGALSGRLVSRSPYLTVLDDQGAFPAAGEGETTACSTDRFRVSVAGNAPIETSLPCDLVLTGSGYDDTVFIPVIVGDSMNLPDGPTAYGLALFDHTDSTFAALPGFDWVELRDVGTPSRLGADEAVQVELPGEFGTWRYFGADYDSLSICSNGFVSAGWSDRVDFVNVQLPYPNAPPNIIAAVWDNLDPPSGGEIWYWHDTAGHRFVVEFDSVPYFAVPAEPERVQVQVFDRTIPTPTGDNRVEILFETANYFEAATVGLQNQDGTQGLTHSWNGWSPRTAAPLTAGRALRLEGVEPTAVAEQPPEPFRAAGLRAVPAIFTGAVRLESSLCLAAALPAYVFSADGRLVRTLAPNRCCWKWDGTDSRDADVPAGVYLVGVRGNAGFARVVFAGR